MVNYDFSLFPDPLVVYDFYKLYKKDKRIKLYSGKLSEDRTLLHDSQGILLINEAANLSRMEVYYGFDKVNILENDYKSRLYLELEIESSEVKLLQAKFFDKNISQSSMDSLLIYILGRVKNTLIESEKILNSAPPETNSFTAKDISFAPIVEGLWTSKIFPLKQELEDEKAELMVSCERQSRVNGVPLIKSSESNDFVEGAMELKYKGEKIDELIYGEADKRGLIQGSATFRIGVKTYTGKFKDSNPGERVIITEKMDGFNAVTVLWYGPEPFRVEKKITKKGYSQKTTYTGDFAENGNLRECSYVHELQYVGEPDKNGDLLAGEFEYVVEDKVSQQVLFREKGKGKFNGFASRNVKEVFMVPRLTSGIRVISLFNDELKQQVHADSYTDVGTVAEGKYVRFHVYNGTPVGYYSGVKVGNSDVPTERVCTMNYRAVMYYDSIAAKVAIEDDFNLSAQKTIANNERIVIYSGLLTEDRKVMHDPHQGILLVAEFGKTMNWDVYYGISKSDILGKSCNYKLHMKVKVEGDEVKLLNVNVKNKKLSQAQIDLLIIRALGEFKNALLEHERNLNIVLSKTGPSVIENISLTQLFKELTCCEIILSEEVEFARIIKGFTVGRNKLGRANNAKKSPVTGRKKNKAALGAGGSEVNNLEEGRGRNPLGLEIGVSSTGSSENSDEDQLNPGEFVLEVPEKAERLRGFFQLFNWCEDVSDEFNLGTEEPPVGNTPLETRYMHK